MSPAYFHRLVTLLAFAQCFSCAGSPSGSDDGAEVPTLSYAVGDVEVAAGADVMTCHYLEPLETDLVVRGFHTLQGPGGHHMVIHRALVPKPAGTVEDCTSGEAMQNLMLALTQTGAQSPGSSSITFPEGMVAVLEAGTQLVLQSHYINASQEPLVSKDTLTIQLTDEDPASLTELHLFVGTSLAFEIPASTSEYTARAGCVLDLDMNMLMLMPHLHERGLRIQMAVGQPGAMEHVLHVEPWQDEWRDLPPVTSFIDEDGSGAALFSAGQSVQIDCTWENPEPQPIRFPQEMCGIVGYFFSETPGATDISCLDLPPR